MEHKGTQPITTKRLTLRRFALSDAEAMYKNWASDPEVTKDLMWPAHTSVEISRHVLTEWTGNYGEMDYYQWAIVLNEEGSGPIGSIAVVKKDDSIQMAHIGYCIGKRWWNRGIMTEALGGVIDYLFREVGVNRIESRHDPRNPGSGIVMLKCGMKYEGTHRDADWSNQGICDSKMYAILARDYFAKKED